MPSGRYLTARVICWSQYRDCNVKVAVHALSEDQGVSQGLCGTNDGDRSNDLTQGGLPYPSYSWEPIEFTKYFW